MFSNELGNKLYNAHEGITGGISIINTDHRFIHKGIAFVAQLDIGTLAAEATESYSFKTPASKYLHFKNLKLSGVGASVKLEIMRGTTDNPLVVDSAGGVATELTGANNVNDNSTTVTGVVIKKTPTYTTNQDGEVWDLITIPGSSTNQFQSFADASFGDNFELVMKPDTYYVLKVTNLSPALGDAASDVIVKMLWYEEEQGTI